MKFFGFCSFQLRWQSMRTPRYLTLFSWLIGLPSFANVEGIFLYFFMRMEYYKMCFSNIQRQHLGVTTSWKFNKFENIISWRWHLPYNLEQNRVIGTDCGLWARQKWGLGQDTCSRFPPSQAGDGVLSANFSLWEKGEYEVVKSVWKRKLCVRVWTEVLKLSNRYPKHCIRCNFKHFGIKKCTQFTANSCLMILTASF